MVGLAYRQAVLEIEAEAAASGIYPARVASEELVLRNDKEHGVYYEGLSHSPGDTNLGLLNTQGVVLQDHDDQQEIGTVLRGSARVCSDKSTRANLRITDTSWRERLARGERPGVSVGYRRMSILRRDTTNYPPTIWFSWSPYECSLLSPGHPAADETAGVFRSRSFMKSSFDELLIDKLLGLDETRGRKPGALSREQTDTWQYSRVLKSEPGQELDFARGNDFRFAMGIPQPFAPLARDMQVSSFAQGGALVATELQGVKFALLNHSAVMRTKATILEKLTSNVSWPRETSPPTVSSVPELTAATKSDPTFDQISMSPKRLTGTFTVSAQLMIQGGEALEAYVRQAIPRVLGQRLDQLILNGAGANSEPLGILSTPGINSITWAGAATWQKVTNCEDALGSFNADGDDCAWIVSPNTRTRWKNIVRTAGGTDFIWDQLNSREALVNGAPAFVTNNLSAGHQSIFANWPFCVVGIWGNDTFWIVIDKYTQAPQGKVPVSVHMWIDVALIHPQAFCVSTDPANQ